MRVHVYDTTLRDGAQREGLSLGISDKIRIALELDALGVSFIEAGWPGANPKDTELFRRLRDAPWTTAALAAFGSTRRANVAPEDDANLAALIDSGAPVCTIFGKSSTLHVREVLRVSLDENLRMIEDSVAYLVANGRRVVYDAEHFFDGAREDERYAMETLLAARRAGAEVVVLCDTNGGTLPWEIEARVRDVVHVVRGSVGVHAHDDSGCAVASSIAAVRAGATHVQGTINGYGERCGNANLVSILPSLELKLGRRCLREGGLAKIGRVARVVAEIANLGFDEHAPYVGKSAFAHKGGVHVAAIRRAPRAYEHVDPVLVGNYTRVVVSELSGRSNLVAKAEEYEIALPEGASAAVLEELKAREASGFAYESAEASFALMIRRKQPGYVPPFELVDYKVIVGQREGTAPFADAAIKVRVRGALHHTAAEGNGPVSALDAALRKALAPAYAEIASIQLQDFKVRILDGRDGTSATTRVLVDHARGSERWTTVGASPSILEASLIALVDGLEHGLWLARATTDSGHENEEHDHEQSEDRLAAG
jgi:2-isopropylmalate synthase